MAVEVQKPGSKLRATAMRNDRAADLASNLRCCANTGRRSPDHCWRPVRFGLNLDGQSIGRGAEHLKPPQRCPAQHCYSSRPGRSKTPLTSHLPTIPPIEIRDRIHNTSMDRPSSPLCTSRQDRSYSLLSSL